MVPGDVAQTRLYAREGYVGRTLLVESVQHDFEEGRDVYWGIVLRRDGLRGRQRLRFTEADVLLSVKGFPVDVDESK